MTALGRLLDGAAWDGEALTLTFSPDLSTGEATVLANAIRDLRERLILSAAERSSLAAALTDLRAFRAQSGAEFSGLTAAQRDAALRTALFGCIDVLRAILRD